MKEICHKLTGKTLFCVVLTLKIVTTDSKHILALEIASADSFSVVKLWSMFCHISVFRGLVLLKRELVH